MFGVDSVGQCQWALHREMMKGMNLEKAHDRPNVILETQINHSISFVHAHVSATIKVEFLLLQHVDESSGSGHDNMNALAESVPLV